MWGMAKKARVVWIEGGRCKGPEANWMWNMTTIRRQDGWSCTRNWETMKGKGVLFRDEMGKPILRAMLATVGSQF